MSSDIPENLERRLERVTSFTGHTREEILLQALREKIRQVEQHQIDLHNNNLSPQQTEDISPTVEDPIDTIPPSDIVDEQVPEAETVSERDKTITSENQTTDSPEETVAPPTQQAHTEDREDKISTWLKESESDYPTTGLQIGCAYTSDDETEDEPISLNPNLLTNHYARVAPQNLARSTAFTNDALSLTEHTSGPLLYITDGGDNATENFLASYHTRFEEPDADERILTFKPPETEPGFSLFDISTDEAYATDHKAAVTRSVRTYKDMLSSVGAFSEGDREREERLIESLIRALYDSGFVDTKVVESFGPSNLPERLNYRAFPHKHMETLINYLFTEYPEIHNIDTIEEATPTDENEQGQGGTETDGETDAQEEITDVLESFNDPTIAETLHSFIETDPETREKHRQTAQRLVRAITDAHSLRHIRDTMTGVFDFRNHLDGDNIFLIDLSNLREKDRSIMLTLILHKFWNAVTDTLGGFKPSEDYVCNLLLENIEPINNTEILDDILTQGRSFNVGVGVGFEDPTAYGNTEEIFATSVGTHLFSNVTLGESYLQQVLHPETDVHAFRRDLHTMQQNQWMVQLAAPTFDSTRPTPFRVKSLPIPEGHQESTQPLAGEDRETFHMIQENVSTRVEQFYTLPI